MTLIDRITSLVTAIGADVKALRGLSNDTTFATIRGQETLTGGGTVSVDGSGNLKWTTRFIVMNAGHGTHFGTQGYFDITMPAVNVNVLGVGGPADRLVTAAGIALSGWESLYYILPTGGTGASVPTNFRIVGYVGADFVIPNNWILVATRNAETGDVRLGSGKIVQIGYSSSQGNPYQQYSLTTHGHALTDPAITGILPDAQLPARIRAISQLVTDLNAGIATTENSVWYTNGNPTGAPVASVSFIGHTQRHATTGYVTQTAYCASDDRLWVRSIVAGVIGSWIQGDRAFLDTRYASVSSKKHYWVDQEYQFEDYSQSQNLRLFVDSAAKAVSRYATIVGNPEFWDFGLGTPAWVSWPAGLPGIKTILDGSENTTYQVPHANRRFRWIMQPGSNYPLMAIILMQTTWTGMSWPGNVTITIESSATPTGTYTTRNTIVFGAGTTAANWGWHLKATDDMHTGDNYWRITFDITNWVDSGTYTTFPLNRFEVVSGYQGRNFMPWTVDYDRVVTFEKTPVIAGVGSIMVSGSAQLDDMPEAWVKRTAQMMTSSNITLSGLQSFDGVTGYVGARTFLTGMTNPGNNGIWLQQTGPWVRPNDFNSLDDAAACIVSVEDGTVYGGSLWHTPFKVTAGVFGTAAMNFYPLIDGSMKGAANGYASLDGTSKIPMAQLPTGTSPTSIVVGNDSRFSRSVTDFGASPGTDSAANTPAFKAAGNGVVPFGTYLVDTLDINMHSFSGPGLARRAPGEISRAFGSREDMFHRRVVHEIPIRFPSYVAALADKGYDYLFPQAFTIFEDRIYICYGGVTASSSNAGAWISVHNAETGAYLRGFHYGTKYGESLAVRREGTSVWLYARTAVQTMGRVNVATLPTERATVTPSTTYANRVWTHFVDDGTGWIISLEPTQYQPGQRNQWRHLAADAMTPDGIFNFEPLDLWPINDQIPQNIKAQGISKHLSNFYVAYGGTFGDGAAESKYQLCGIRKLGDSGRFVDSALMHPQKVIDKFKALGLACTLIEMEGISSWNNALYALWITTSHTNTGAGGIVITEELVGDENFHSCAANMSVTNDIQTLNGTILNDYQGIRNPTTGELFTSDVDIIEFMRDVGLTNLGYYTTGSVLPKVGGGNHLSGSLVRITTGNFASWLIEEKWRDGSTEQWVAGDEGALTLLSERSFFNGMRSGVAAGTSDANGNLTVNHGGSSAIATITFGSRNLGVVPYLTGGTATTFTARLLSRATGAPVTVATAYSFDWQATF